MQAGPPHPAALCPSEATLWDHAGLNHSGLPLLPTAAPVPRVAPASRKAFKSCDQPPGQQCALGPGPAVLWGLWEEPPIKQPPVWLQKRDHLLARLDRSISMHSSQQLRDRKPALHAQKGSGLTLQFQEALCASHLPWVQELWGHGEGAAGVHRVFPVASWAAASQEG